MGLPWMLLQDLIKWQRPTPTLDAVKVQVILGVMSRCPDALVCENTWDQVLTKVKEKVDASMIYIGKYGVELLVSY